MKKSLFEFVVLFHETDKEGDVIDSKVIIEPTTILAAKESDVLFKVTRQIPDKYAETPDNVEILVRAF